MKHLNLLKSTLLLCALIVGSTSVWADEEPVVTADFTAKTTGHSDYTDTWTYGDWSITHCSNNNKEWGYIRCGGKGGSTATSTKTSSSVIQGTSKIGSAIKEVRLLHNGTSNNSATINFFKLEVATDAAFTNITNTITDDTAISKEVAGTITFNTGAPYAANSYYRVTINWTIKGKSNYGIDVTKVEFYEPSSTPSISAANVNIAYDATGGTIASTISNPVVGGVLTAVKKTEADWLTLGDVSGTNVPFTTTANDGAYDREAVVTLTYTYNTSETATKDVTITQAHLARDYATLPFNWEGGGKIALNAIDGVTTSSLDDDYTNSHAPYLVKFNGTGKFIIVKTDCQPTKVTMGVKMIGGDETSTMSIQESADGETYTKVQDLSISGSTNDIVNLESTEPFKAETRYVKFLYTKGSNVGVGPITISNTVSTTITDAEYATFVSPYATNFSTTGVTVYTATAGETSVTLNEVASGKVPANTPVVLYKAGADGTAINVPVIASAYAVGSNDLKVSTGGEPTNAYVLANKTSGVGFYKWAGGSLTSGKIYLQGTASAREFLGFGDVTGINSVLGSELKVNGYFDLQGRRVAQPTKGLYIVNGRKVVIK